MADKAILALIDTIACRHQALQVISALIMLVFLQG